MAKYNVGDKVVIRKDLEVYASYGIKNFVPNMEEMCVKHNYILTIKKVYEDDGYDVYVMEEDKTGLDFVWTDQMIEKLYVDTTDTKFEAFLKEVIDGTSEENYEAWDKIRVLTKGINDDSKKETTIQWLTDFYNNFVPKGEIVKKMTKVDIEAELGYKIEIVEE